MEFVGTNEDEKYMKDAYRQAKKAYALGEVPIGCVIVHEGKAIGRGYNRRNTDKSTLAHAEITAIKRASKVIGDWRLEECTMYVTLEPCQMCAGAIVQARIPRVVMACMNPKAGCGGSVLNILAVLWRRSVPRFSKPFSRSCAFGISWKKRLRKKYNFPLYYVTKIC